MSESESERMEGSSQLVGVLKDILESIIVIFHDGVLRRHQNPLLSVSHGVEYASPSSSQEPCLNDYKIMVKGRWCIL
jgi:hypothetical protein